MFRAITLLAALLFYCQAYASDLDLTYHGSVSRDTTQVEPTSVVTEHTCKVDLTRDPLTYAAVVAIAADWGTTRDIVRREKDGYYENGPIARKVIGAHPTAARVHQYFAAVTVAHLVARCYLPEWASNLTMGYAVLEHGRAAINNYQIGLRVKF